MKCSSVIEELSAYVDGELTADIAAQVQAHLRECDLCAAEAEEVAHMRGLLRSLPATEPPPHVAELSLRAVIRVSRRRQRSRWEAPRWWRRLWSGVPAERRPTVAATAVAIALALVIAPWSFSRHHPGAVAAEPTTDWDAMTINLRRAPRTLWGTAVEAGKGIQGAFGGARENDEQDSQSPGDDRDEGALLQGRPGGSSTGSEPGSARPASLTRRLAA